MKLYEKIKNHCKIFLEKTIKKKERNSINQKNRTNLKNHNFSIISQNCNGGVIYHDLGLEFLSPTINLYFQPRDFIKFLKNMDYYLNCEIKECLTEKVEYPVLLIDDIKVFCVHYKSFQDAKDKWNIRKKRINKKNIFVIMNERDNCTYEDLLEFDQLEFDNKVVFVKKEMPDIKSSYYIKGSEDLKNKGQGIISLVKYKSLKSGKRYLDDFDYVAFLNKETKYNK